MRLTQGLMTIALGLGWVLPGLGAAPGGRVGLKDRGQGNGRRFFPVHVAGVDLCLRERSRVGVVNKGAVFLPANCCRKATADKRKAGEGSHGSRFRVEVPCLR
jgi:hypothetical protein